MIHGVLDDARILSPVRYSSHTVDHRTEILSHDRDYSNVHLHETALLQFSILWTKAEEILSEKAGRKQKERSGLPLSKEI